MQLELFIIQKISKLITAINVEVLVAEISVLAIFQNIYFYIVFFYDKQNTLLR